MATSLILCTFPCLLVLYSCLFFILIECGNSGKSPYRNDVRLIDKLKHHYLSYFASNREAMQAYEPYMIEIYAKGVEYHPDWGFPATDREYMELFLSLQHRGKKDCIELYIQSDLDDDASATVYHIPCDDGTFLWRKISTGSVYGERTLFAKDRRFLTASDGIWDVDLADIWRRMTHQIGRLLPPRTQLPGRLRDQSSIGRVFALHVRRAPRVLVDLRQQISDPEPCIFLLDLGTSPLAQISGPLIARATPELVYVEGDNANYYQEYRPIWLQRLQGIVPAWNGEVKTIYDE